jgi:hypothetical protein
MGDKGESMTDAEIVNSLGFEVRQFDQHTLFIVTDSDGQGWVDPSDSEQEAIEEFCNAPAMWLHLDDALAKRGWATRLEHGMDGNGHFDYTAIKSVDGQGGLVDLTKFENEHNDESRNSAVREVYERVMEQEQTP